MPPEVGPVTPQNVQAMRQQFFQKRREDLSRQGTVQNQEAQDAIQRRMASIGQVASGASIAAQTKAREGLLAQQAAAENELSGQELQSQMAEAEAERGRMFASDQAAKDMAFKRGLFDIEQGNKLKELDLAERQFLLDKDTTEFNRKLAEIEAARKDPTFLDQLGIGGLNRLVPGKSPGEQLGRIALAPVTGGISLIPKGIIPKKIKF